MSKDNWTPLGICHIDVRVPAAKSTALLMSLHIRMLFVSPTFEPVDN